MFVHGLFCILFVQHNYQVVKSNFTSSSFNFQDFMLKHYVVLFKNGEIIFITIMYQTDKIILFNLQ